MIELNGGHVVALQRQKHQSTTIHYIVVTAGSDGDGAPHHEKQGHKHHPQLISPSFLEDCVESQVTELVILIFLYWYC